MIKKFSTVALAGLLALPSLASAGSSDATIEALERQMQEMTKMFNQQINALKSEISDLKAKDQQMSKEMSSVAAAPAPAAPQVAAAPAAASWTDNFMMGGRVRMRGYNLQNVWNFNDDMDNDNWDVFRHKTDIWLKVDPTEKVSGFIQLSNQNWGEGVSQEDATNWEIDNMSNKVFIDNAYIDVKEMFDLPVNARIGRQNVIYGSGFVLFDGNSQFGSTSIFLDGVKLSWNITDNVMLDGLYFKDWEGSRDNDNNDDITVGGAYLTNKACPLTGAKQEFYVLNRSDENLDKDMWMYGIRLSDKLDCGFDYSLEGAIQKGDAMEDVDQDALGYKLDAGYTFKEADMKPRLYMGYAFLSGDEDPNDDDSERWDVFYGGHAPQFGDIIAWKYLNVGANNAIANTYDPTYNELSSTGGEAVFSNFGIFSLGASAALTKNLSADFRYSLMTADETASGFDDDIGDVYQLTMKYQYSKKLAFRLYGAMFDPGDAFDDGTNTWDEDEATEVFIEADYRF